MHTSKTFLTLGAILLSSAALAQSYFIDRFTIAGGGNSSTSGSFALSGTTGQPEAGRMNDSRFVIEGGFWGLPTTETSAVTSTTIFDNTNGVFNGAFLVTTTSWQAGKFCIGSQPYRLDSLSLLLGVPGFDVRTSTVQLQILSNDPSSGKPFTSTGVIMNLSSMTNPVSLSPNVPGKPVTWIPSTPFTLMANECYWAVLSVESGSSVRLAASQTKPTGDVGTFGRVGSTDAGVTWGVPDTFSNHMMLIRGTALAPPPALVFSEVRFSGNELRFSFPTSTGKTYLIESRESLASDIWAEVPVTRQTSAGAAFEMSLPIRQAQPQQFYRVKQSP